MGIKISMEISCDFRLMKDNHHDQKHLYYNNKRKFNGFINYCFNVPNSNSPYQQLREPQPQKGNLGSLNLYWKALGEEGCTKMVSNCLDIWWRDSLKIE